MGWFCREVAGDMPMVWQHRVAINLPGRALYIWGLVMPMYGILVRKRTICGNTLAPMCIESRRPSVDSFADGLSQSL